MPRYLYNNIIKITNVFILDFLCARFVDPDTPQLTVLSFFNTS